MYVYYQLDNFYQNHRRYVKSRDYKQLGGVERSADEVKTTCDPIVLNSDLAPQITKSINGTPLVPTNVANPCGLIAKSYFTDSYSLYPTSIVNGKTVTSKQSITIDDSNIAWNSDVKYKFKNLDSPN